MATILLAFCLSSLSISSVIVCIELLRERRKYQQITNSVPRVVRAATRSTSLNRSHSSGKNKPAPPQVSQRFLAELTKQMRELGYTSSEQQLNFINRVIGRQYTQVTDLTTHELKKVHAYINRYKTDQEEPVSSLIPQSA